jgi:hypothetical protein
MGRERFAPAAMGTLQIAGDDVPADPAAGEVVERREPPGEGVGRLRVTPKPRCSVTAAMAGTMSVGSLTGNCTASRAVTSMPPP